jgi:hypothetical protein
MPGRTAALQNCILRLPVAAIGCAGAQNACLCMSRIGTIASATPLPWENSHVVS